MHACMSILEPSAMLNVMIMSSMHNRIQGSYKTLGAMNTQHPICRDCTGSMELYIQNNCSIVEMLRIQTCNASYSISIMDLSLHNRAATSFRIGSRSLMIQR